MNKTNEHLNSSVQVELSSISAVCLETDLQSYQSKPSDQKNLNHAKNKISFNEPLQNIVDDLLKFRSDRFFQGRISDVEQILRECEWTDILMKILEYGNSHVLLSHKYRVEMENEHIDRC